MQKNPGLPSDIQVFSSNHQMSAFPLQSTVVEEEEDGMIYTVAVKHHHGALNSPMVNHMWWKGQKCLHCLCDKMSGLPSVFMQRTVSRSQSVKAGTEEKLVLHLLHSYAIGDSSYISIFLSTYRSFTSTKRVLDILNDRWEGFITTLFDKSQININAKIKKKNQAECSGRKLIKQAVATVKFCNTQNTVIKATCEKLSWQI